MTELSVLLQKFKTAVSSDDIEAAGRIAGRLQKSYNNRKSDRQRRLRQSLLVRDSSTASSDQRRTAQEYVQTTAATDLAWSSFLMIAATFLEYPKEVDKEKMLGTTDALAARESDFEESAAAVDPIVDTTDFPAAVDILAVRTPESPISAGKTARLTIVIGNVGDEPARGVQLETRGDTGIEIDPPPVSIGALDIGVNSTHDASFVGKKPGRYSLEFKLSADNTASATEQVHLAVYSEEALVRSQNGSAEQGQFPEVGSEDIPDWLPVAGGAALGFGAGAYGYLKDDSDERDGKTE